MGLKLTSTTLKLLVMLTMTAVVTQFTSSASAIPVPLNSGATVVATQTAGPPAGAIHLAGNSQNFQSQDMPLNPNGTSFTGNLASDVWTSYPGNLFGPGALTFTYLLSNNGPDPLHRLTTTNFAGYLVDVEYDSTFSNPVGLTPNTTDRNAAGNIVGWNYDLNPRVPTGASTALLIIHTDATQYVPALASVINSATAGILSFGPAPVPEPAALSALALAAGIGLTGRRAKRQ